jgi:alkylation response protein AidB-like acyl-CoA dehydrogenase
MTTVSTPTQPLGHESDELRERVRAWLAQHGTRRPNGRYPIVAPVAVDYEDGLEVASAYQRQLWDAGLAGLSVPRAFGGCGLESVAERLFEEESGSYVDPRSHLMISLGMCIPTLLTHGTSEQCQRWIAPILRGDENWCQLFSEPSAGSDLGALACLATPAEGGWVVHGEKVWNSGASSCSRGLLIARTPGTGDGTHRRSFTLFGLDMTTPGVVVRRIRQMTGAYGFCSVELDGVFVPESDRIGFAGDGWTAVATTLGSERAAIGSGLSNRSPVGWQNLRSAASHLDGNIDPTTRQAIAAFFVDETILSLLAERMATKAGTPAPHPSLAKLARAELAWAAVDAATRSAQMLIACQTGPEDPNTAWSSLALAAPAQSIGGGTSEIARNTIAERVLGLPREPTAYQSTNHASRDGRGKQ